MNLNNLDTEQSNPDSLHIDEMSTIDILTTINNEDQKVAFAVKDVLPQISDAVDCIYQQMSQGGRLIYIGAGTSGRLGVLDASECPPTYGVDPRLVQGLIAGGNIALTTAIEGAEDSQELAVEDLKKPTFLPPCCSIRALYSSRLCLAKTPLMTIDLPASLSLAPLICSSESCI